MGTSTRMLHDLADGLRQVADLFEEASVDVGVLAMPCDISVTVTPTGLFGGDEAAKLATIKQLANAIGGAPTWENPLRNTYGVKLNPDDTWWSIWCYTHAKRPDPADELRSENERLRARLAELEARPGPVEDEHHIDPTTVEHRHIGGAAGGPGEHEAWCECGQTFCGFDSQHEAAAELERHIANPEPRCEDQDDPAADVDALDDIAITATDRAELEPDADGDLIAPVPVGGAR